MTTITTFTNQLYADGMQLSGQAAYGNQAIGQLQASSSVSLASTTITFVDNLPSWVASSQIVWDITANVKIGTVSSASNNTLTLTADSLNVSTGASDVMQFGFTPSDISTGFGDGYDIRGIVQLMRLHASEIKRMATDLQTNVITSTQDAAANTILTNIINNC
jgi:hypothetical protein